ncbi:MFS transporter [Sphingomonas sp. SUN039]|uniref:MFS transporter n=1 Tax=Sphingomonas sp. SUN039 TaxID=2937787 RepID=UPI002164DB71|nr:MFS transporter [Sphingomonas sp. SUN039]UVO54349.1 MFS transporter [Sphingomonas sp. SUN039]
MTGLALLFPITLSVMAALFVAPIAPKIAETYGPTGLYTPDELGRYIGWIITVPSLCVALFSIPAGWLGDKVGRYRLLVVSMAIYVVVGVMPYFLTDLGHILWSRIAVGVVEAMLMTLSTTLIADFFKGQARNRWLAAQTGTASTFAIAAILVAGLVGAARWQNVFLLYLVPVVFLVLVLRFAWEPEESEHLANRDRQGRWSDIPWGPMGLICVITLFGSVMFYTVQIKLPDAFKDLGVVLPGGGYDAARGGMMTAVASLFVPVGTLCFFYLSPRLSLKAMFLVEFALLGTGFLLMSVLRDPWMFTLAAGLDQIGAGMLLPTLLTWAVAQLPFEVRGRGTGIWNAVFALGQFVCNNLAMPFIMGFTGGILPSLGVLGWMCLAAAAIALVAPLRTPAPLAT